VSLGVFGRKPYPRAPGPELTSWDSLDITLYNLAGQYRPRCEGDKMVVNYESRKLCDTENLLWRYRERGVLQHQGH